MDINKTKLHYNSWVLTSGGPVDRVSFLGVGGMLAVGPTWVPQSEEGQRKRLVSPAVAGTLLTFLERPTSVPSGRKVSTLALGRHSDLLTLMSSACSGLPIQQNSPREAWH